MSDQPPDPTDEPRTFWYRCAWGHMEERELASEDAPPLRCSAVVPTSEAAQDRPLGGPCTAELHFFGPSVGEWRAANFARDAEHTQRLHAERLLEAADSALAECGGQIDELRARLDQAEQDLATSMRNEGDLGAQLDHLSTIEMQRGQIEEAHSILDHVRSERDQALRESAEARDHWAKAEDALACVAAELDWPEADPIIGNGLVQRIRERDAEALHLYAGVDAKLDEARSEIAGLRESVEIAKTAMHEMRDERDAALADAAETRHSEAECQDALAVAREDHRRAVALGMEVGEQVSVARRHQETAERDRDKARAERQDYANRLATLRAFLNAEAEEAERRGRHRLAARWREAKTASWSEVKVEPGYVTLEEFGTACRERGSFVSDAIDAVLSARAAAVEGEAKRRVPQPEVATITDGCLITFLGAPLVDWQAACAELRELYALDSDYPALMRKAVYEIREARRKLRSADDAAATARADFEELRQRMLRAERKVGELRTCGKGFTVVRNVNQQTERERDKAREELRAAETMRNEARSVAAWAVSKLTNVHHDYAQARAAYERAIDAEDDWDAPPAAAAEILGEPSGMEPLPLIEPGARIALLEGRRVMGWQSPPLQVLSVHARRNIDGDCYEALLTFGGARPSPRGEGTLALPSDVAVRFEAGTLLAIDDGKGLPLARAKVESIELHADALGPYSMAVYFDRSHLRIDGLG